MNLRYFSFLIFSLVAHKGIAQIRYAPEADTTGHVKGIYGKGTDRYYYGTLTKIDGTVIRAYLPASRTGYEREIDFFFGAPAQMQSDKRFTVKIKDIKSMTVHGRVYEAVSLQKKSPEVLALDVLDGPVSLALYAEPRALPIPIPLGVGAAMPIVGIGISDKNHWYLRQNGVWAEITRVNFAQRMSAYLVDDHELAGKVLRGETGYQQADTPAIIAEYNRKKSSGGQ